MEVSRAEPSRAEPSRVEESRAESSGAEPRRPEAASVLNEVYRRRYTGSGVRVRRKTMNQVGGAAGA